MWNIMKKKCAEKNYLWIIFWRICIKQTSPNMYAAYALKVWKQTP